MSVPVDEALRSRVKNLEAMPAMPAILAQLRKCLDLPAEQIEMEKITELISRDKSIAAQCLRMANFAAVLPIPRRNRSRRCDRPLERLASGIFSGRRFCSDVPERGVADKAERVFWEHSFGCAFGQPATREEDRSAGAGESRIFAGYCMISASW